MKYSDKELCFMVERIEKQQFELNEWEQGFFASIRPRILAGIPISSKQHECLSKIWDKVTEV
jgi:hypothetical protein